MHIAIPGMCLKKEEKKEIKGMSYFVLGPVPSRVSCLQKIQGKQTVSMNIFRAASSLGVEGGQMLRRDGEATGTNPVGFYHQNNLIL